MEQDLLDTSASNQWIASFYFAITTGTTVGYGDISATNSLEQIYGVALLIGAVAYIGHYVGRVGQLCSSLNQGEAEMMTTKRDAMAFMQKRVVPKTLYQKVLRYIAHVYETDSLTSLDHTGFLDKLSESLQMELRLAVRGNFLRKFPLFENADDAYAKAICQICRTEDRLCFLLPLQPWYVYPF